MSVTPTTFGAAPDSPDYKGPLFGEQLTTPDQTSLLEQVSGDTKESRGVLQGLALPEVPTKPQKGVSCYLSEP